MLNKNEIDVKIELSEGNRLRVICNAEKAEKYAYYIYKNDEIIEKFPYGDSNILSYWIGESGNYFVKVFFLDSDSNKISKETETVVFDEEKVFGQETSVVSKSLANGIIEITKELFSNKTIIMEMAKFDYKLQNKDTYLGKLWAFLTPLIQIGTYWLVFGLGIRNGKDVDGFPYLAWMLSGLIPWFFISSCIVKSANSIYTKANIVTKMKFPIATIPISSIFQQAYEFMVMLFILFVMMLSMGIWPNWSWLNLVYYIMYTFVFCISLSLVTSVLTMLARDFYKLLNSLIRLLFYLTPILWVMDNMPFAFKLVVNCNPIYYIVQGFRDSILYQVNFWERTESVFIMWVINIVLYCIGCSLQAKFKYKFIDMI